MSRIVVAEDDPRQADLLRSYLQTEGHDVTVVHDGLAALEAIRSQPTDLCLLDVMMPKLDGLDVCRILRREQLDTAVIVVTARSGDDDLVIGLDLGADDYVTKPYSMRQLMARVRAVLRRTTSSDEAGPLTLGGLSIDHGRCEVSVDGRPVELTAKELSILESLAQQPGRVLSRQQLLRRIGSAHDVLERTVDMHVANLRRKIEPDPERPIYVRTVKGRGYKLADSPVC